MLFGFLGGDMMKFASFTNRLSVSSCVLNATLRSRTSECTLFIAPIIVMGQSDAAQSYKCTQSLFHVPQSEGIGCADYVETFGAQLAGTISESQG